MVRESTATKSDAELSLPGHSSWRMRAAHSSGDAPCTTKSLFTCTGRRNSPSWSSPTITSRAAEPSSRSSDSTWATLPSASPRAS